MKTRTTRKKKVQNLNTVANRMAEIAETHLTKLAPSERAARLRAFKKIVFGVRKSAATVSGSSRTQAIRLAARGRG